jgi:hypothetical protein
MSEALTLFSTERDEFGVSLSDSCIMGERETDIEWGIAAGDHPATRAASEAKADYEVGDLAYAAEMIINAANKHIEYSRLHSEYQVDRLVWGVAFILYLHRFWRFIFCSEIAEPITILRRRSGWPLRHSFLIAQSDGTLFCRDCGETNPQRHIPPLS